MGRGIAFIVALVCGATSTVVFAALPRFENIALAVGLNALALAAYLLWILYTERQRRLYEQHADSMYYLGFMLTLWSLIVTFVMTMGQGEDADLRSLLGKFGVGLTTTLIGLACRIWLLELQGTAQRTLDESFNSLQIAAERFQLVLEQGSYAIEEAHRNFLSRMQDRQNDMHFFIESTMKTMSSQLDAHAREFERAAGRIAGSTDQASQDMKTKILGLSDAFQELSLEVAESTNVIRRRMGEFEEAFKLASRSISSVEVPKDFVRNLLNDSLHGVVEATERFQQWLGKLDTPIDSLGKRLSDLGESTAQAGKGIEKVQEVGALVTNLGQVLASFQTAVDQLEGHLTRLERNLASSVDTAEAQRAKLGALADSNLQSVERIRQEMEEHVRETANALRKVSGQLTDSVREIRTSLGG